MVGGLAYSWAVAWQATGPTMADSHEGYFFLRKSKNEALCFEVFTRDDGWYWHPRPPFSPPGVAHGPFTTTDEAYQDALASPDSHFEI